MMSMRRRRRSAPRSYRKTIQHVTSVMAQNPGNNLSVTHIIGNAGAYAFTGTSAATIVTAGSNAEQEYVIGSNLGRTTINLGLRNTAAPHTVDVIIWKRERQSTTPVPGTGLPTDANILSVGGQMAFRQEMPGRVLYYNRISLSLGTPRNVKIVINWSKYKLSKIRQGDWYGITIFNRAGAATFFADIETRTKEIQ